MPSSKPRKSLGRWIRRRKGSGPGEDPRCDSEAHRRVVGDSLVLEADLFPPALKLRMFRHDVARGDDLLACETYLTVGLEAVGHREVRVTFPRTDDAESDSHLVTVGKFFIGIYELAETGKTVGPLSFSWFGEEQLSFGAVVWSNADELPGVNTPSGTLQGIFMKPREYDVLVRHGNPLRALAYLGKRYYHYPWPSWSDPGRPDLPENEDFPPSCIGKVSRRIVADSSVTREGDTVVFRVGRLGGGKVNEAVSDVDPADGVVVCTGLSASAGGCLSWQPGQEGTWMNVPGPPRDAGAARACGDMSVVRLGGTFLAVVRSNDETMGGVTVEDGYCFSLDGRHWSAIRQAIHDRSPVRVNAHDSEHLSLDVRFENAVNGAHASASH